MKASYVYTLNQAALGPYEKEQRDEMWGMISLLQDRGILTGHALYPDRFKAQLDNLIAESQFEFPRPGDHHLEKWTDRLLVAYGMKEQIQ